MRSAVIGTIALIVWFTNLFAFFCGALLIGGDAVNGKVVAGHYFVAKHGKYTEVSKAVYTYSLVHVYSLFIMLPFFIGAMAYFVLSNLDSFSAKGRMKF